MITGTPYRRSFPRFACRLLALSPFNWFIRFHLLSNFSAYQIECSHAFAKSNVWESHVSIHLWYYEVLKLSSLSKESNVLKVCMGKTHAATLMTSAVEAEFVHANHACSLGQYYPAERVWGKKSSYIVR